MGNRHPLDHLGRPLPPCDWPTDRAAPDHLEPIRRLCNTTNLESGAERLTSPVEADRWLVEQGMVSFDGDHRPVVGSPAALQRLIEVREVLRAAAVAHRDRVEDGPAVASLVDLVGSTPLALGLGPDGLTVHPAPSASPLDRFLSSLALGIVEGRRDGTWPRVKACHQCRWVFFDDSKNRSSRWCSMQACGGRAKVRAHRQRQAGRAGAEGGPD